MVQVKLKVQAGSNAGKEIPVAASPFVIGRADECQLRPKSDAISRNHCSIVTEGDEVVIRDLKSRNGTYVNEEKLTGDRPLRHGDVIRIGKLTFEVVVAGAAAPVAAAVQEPPTPTTASQPVAEKTVAEKTAAVAAASKAAPVREAATKTVDGSSAEFDINEWLEEVSSTPKTQRSDPDTRQFKLDETDRIALEKAAQEQEDAAGDSSAKKFVPPSKKLPPGKLPERNKQAANSSREAAADMLKKYFNNR